MKRMAKGLFKLQIRSRTLGKTPRGEAIVIDKLFLYYILDKNKKKYYLAISKTAKIGKCIISRDEVAFVKLLYSWYGPGDYCIQTWARGKNKGKRGFVTIWDGLVYHDKKFLRRKIYSASSIGNIFAKESFSATSKDLRKYFKTKAPGVFHNF